MNNENQGALRYLYKFHNNCGTTILGLSGDEGAPADVLTDIYERFIEKNNESTLEQNVKTDSVDEYMHFTYELAKNLANNPSTPEYILYDLYETLSGETEQAA